MQVGEARSQEHRNAKLKVGRFSRTVLRCFYLGGQSFDFSIPVRIHSDRDKLQLGLTGDRLKLLSRSRHAIQDFSDSTAERPRTIRLSQDRNAALDNLR